jgi:hypothetical protein
VYYLDLDRGRAPVGGGGGAEGKDLGGEGVRGAGWGEDMVGLTLTPARSVLTAD